METRLTTIMEDRDPTPHRNLETEMQMWLTARPVTTKTLQSMDAEYLKGLKVERHQQKQKSEKLGAITTEEAKLVGRAASLNLSVEQYVTKKLKAEGISSPKESPKNAKGNDMDDATPGPRPQAVTLPAQV